MEVKTWRFLKFEVNDQAAFEMKSIYSVWKTMKSGVHNREHMEAHRGHALLCLSCIHYFDKTSFLLKSRLLSIQNEKMHLK